MAHLITGNKFDPNTDIPDLHGKVYIVTGGTAGIGYGITAHLLQHNAAKVILLSMKEEHAKDAMEALKGYGDTARVHWMQCDLKNLKDIEKVAQQLKQEETQLDGVGGRQAVGMDIADGTTSSYVTPAKAWENTTRPSTA